MLSTGWYALGLGVRCSLFQQLSSILGPCQAWGDLRNLNGLPRIWNAGSQAEHFETVEMMNWNPHFSQ